MRDPGPHVAAILFCENAEVAEDGTVRTLIRPHHNVTLRGVREPHWVVVYICVIGGPGSARARIEVVFRPPKREAQTVFDELRIFDGTGVGHEVNIKLEIAPSDEGTFWVDVLINGIVRGHVPFNVTRLQDP